MNLLKLPFKKELSLVSWTIKRPAIPEKISVSVYSDAPFYQQVTVAPGQAVSFGQVLAKPRSATGIASISPYHGVVSTIENKSTPEGCAAVAIEIATDRKNPAGFLTTGENHDWLHEETTPEQIRKLIRAAGVQMMGPLAVPLCHYLEEGPFKNQTLVVNACESEPYATSNQVLLMAHPMEIVKGAEILRRAAGLKKVVIALSQNAEQAAEILRSKIYFLKWPHIEVRVFPLLYPQDSPVVLLPMLDLAWKNVSPQKRQTVALPEPADLFAAYEAVVLGKPHYERVVTVTGECVVQPQNVWLPFGYPLSDALKACKGLLREPACFLSGGPMRGKAILDRSLGISAQTQTLTALPVEWTEQSQAQDCTRCGDCLSVCPVNLSPPLLAAAALREDYDFAKQWHSEQCFSCGNCAYVCPSHLPLVEMIQSVR